MTWVTSTLIEVTQEVWEHREEKGGKLLLGRGVEKSLCLCWPHLLGVSLGFSTFSCVWRATGHKSSEPIQSAISYQLQSQSEVITFLPFLSRKSLLCIVLPNEASLPASSAHPHNIQAAVSCCRITGLLPQRHEDFGSFPQE